MIPQTVDRIARTVQSSARSGAAVAGIFRASMRHIVAKVPLDGWCGLTLDPATLLMTGGVHEHGLQPTAIRRLLEIEYGESDVNLFSDLARAKLPAGSLWDATAGRPEQSARYRDVLRPNGYEGELRAVLRAGGCSWGALVLLRRIGRPAFNADQLALLAALSEPIAKERPLR